VRFGYEPGREILKGLDLDIPAGTSCAIVGPSGAGKSTIARLLYRFYDPTGGPDH
jgi:ABC-type multidrug transport system fused ATPase/permease subunit